MTRKNQKTSADKLEELLDAERLALIDGQLDQITDLLPEKEFLITRIHQDSELDPAVLNRLQEKLSRNQDLLSSAMDGIRAVAERLNELRKIQNGLNTYDRRGQMTRYAAASRGDLEKRA